MKSKPREWPLGTEQPVILHFPCRHTALVWIYTATFRTDDRIIGVFFIPSMTQTKKKIIIKFYKLAATKNKQESTIRNESEALTESALRTITLMQSQGLRRSQ